MKDYEKVKECLRRFRGDDRKEFFAAFIGGSLTDTTRLHSRLIRKELGVGLIRTFGRAYGLLSWWWFSDARRRKIMGAFRIAIENPHYREAVVNLARDAGKKRVLNALTYAKGFLGENQNLSYLIETVAGLPEEGLKEAPGILGRKVVRVTAVVDSLKALAEALKRPFIEHLPQKKFMELPQEIVESGEGYEIRADVRAVNAQHALEEEIVEAIEGAPYVAFIGVRGGRSFSLLSRNYKVLKGSRVIGIVELSGEPPNVSEEVISELAGIPVFSGSVAKNVFYNMAIIAVGGWFE